MTTIIQILIMNMNRSKKFVHIKILNAKKKSPCFAKERIKELGSGQLGKLLIRYQLRSREQFEEALLHLVEVKKEDRARSNTNLPVFDRVDDLMQSRRPHTFYGRSSSSRGSRAISCERPVQRSIRVPTPPPPPRRKRSLRRAEESPSRNRSCRRDDQVNISSRAAELDSRVSATKRKAEEPCEDPVRLPSRTEMYSKRLRSPLKFREKTSSRDAERYTRSRSQQKAGSTSSRRAAELPDPKPKGQQRRIRLPAENRDTSAKKDTAVSIPSRTSPRCRTTSLRKEAELDRRVCSTTTRIEEPSENAARPNRRTEECSKRLPSPPRCSKTTSSRVAERHDRSRSRRESVRSSSKGAAKPTVAHLEMKKRCAKQTAANLLCNSLRKLGLGPSE